MDCDDYIARWDAAFNEAKHKALSFIEHYNSELPINACPHCQSESGHVPGLACCDCGYIHPIPWAVLRSSEYGWDVVGIGNSRHRIISFEVEDIDGV